MAHSCTGPASPGHQTIIQVRSSKALCCAHTNKRLGTVTLFLQLSLAEISALDAEATMVLLPPKTWPLSNSARPQLACDVALWQCTGLGRQKGVSASPYYISQRTQLLLIEWFPVAAPIHWYLCNISDSFIPHTETAAFRAQLPPRTPISYAHLFHQSPNPSSTFQPEWYVVQNAPECLVVGVSVSSETVGNFGSL